MTAPGKKTAAPALDLASLTVTKAPAPRRQGNGGGIDVRKTSVYTWIADSWKNKSATGNSQGQPVFLGEGMAVVVPTANVVQLEFLIRKAAALLSADLNERIGVAIATEALKGNDKNKTRITFAAKTGKKPYTRKPKNAPATPAATA